MNEKIYIDFEMNKFRDGPGEIIAIGAVKVLGDHIVDRFHSLVALEKSDEVCVHVTLLTGITNFDIQKAKPFKEVWANFTAWAGEGKVYCWGDYDKQCLGYTCRINKRVCPQLCDADINCFVNKMIDLELAYGYSTIYHKQSLKDILLSLNKNIVINERQLHHPTYDAELLFEFHRQIKKPKV